MLFVGSDGLTYNVKGDELTGRLYVDMAGGSGTVTSVSVVPANGFAGSVATATTTPAITLTTTINAPILAGNGTAISAATTTGSGSTVVLATSPTLVTPILGVAAATSINKVVITAPATSATLTIVDGKTVTFNNSITFAGTDATVMTFPTTSATIARTDAANTFTGTQTFNGTVALGAQSLTMTGSIAATGARVTKGWFTDIESTNMPTVGGTAILTSLTAPQFTTIELGDASDTTLSRSAAGVLAVESVVIPTISSTSTLTNKTISHTVEPASDDTMTGEVITGLNAGATIAQWETVYLGSASKWLLTDADATSSAGGVILGLATTSGTDTNPLTVALRGVIRNDGWTWATVGAPLYLSTTAGAITDTAPSGTDDVIRIIGYVLSDDCIYLNPSSDWITHT